ncbi:MAG: hypothetical protein Q7J61_02675, partial [Deltaproteobacteria bacterium]|nr:hypothetical protein [Deltaproteobacteria bacterium]
MLDINNKMDLTKKDNEMDKRIPRLWYLPNTWKEVTKFPTLRDLQEHLAKHEWANTINWDEIGSTDNSDWKAIERVPHIFLSRAPLTFGHSQLVIPSPQGNNQDEENFFCLASKIIERVIVAFRKAFIEQKLHKDKTFSELAEITHTEGDYIKTLILRSSASENVCKEYKIHLVPYFQSHEEQCERRFRNLHGIMSKEKGGLLGWIGDRENIADSWQVGRTPCKYRLDDVANADLKMSEIA